MLKGRSVGLLGAVRERFKLSALEWLLLAGLCLATLIHLYLVTLGWNNSLGGAHDFRQTQTAIATWYFLQGGAELDYRIPVLGPQWRLPHELPVYQAVVAGWCRFTGMPLEPAGRLFSLLSFYACVGVLIGILKTLRQPMMVILGALILMFSTATYIYYSRTFLIEPMALLFSLLFLWGCLRILHREASPGWRDLWLVPVTAIAATIKLTTFSVSMGLVVMLVGLELLNLSQLRTRPGWQRRLAVMAATLAIGVLAAFLWNKFVLHSWSLSPQYADAHIGMHKWNFGELRIRNDPAYWGRIYAHMLALPFGSGIIALVSLVAFTFAPREQRVRAFAFLAAWMSGFLVWGNLYFVHDYYGYASAIFFILFAVASLHGLTLTWKWLRWPVGLFFLVLATGQFLHYRHTLYYGSQIDDWGVAKRDFAVSIQQYVKPDDVLLIFGEDWSPFIAYYSQRYANMVRWEGYWVEGRYLESLNLMRAEGRRFGGVVVRKTPAWLADFEGFRNHYHLKITDAPVIDTPDFLFYQVTESFP